VAGSSATSADTAAIESLLGRYRSAFEALDVNAVQAVWPTVNARALGSAFNQLESQDFEFGECKIDVTGAQANAVCAGTATFVPTVGSRNARVEARRWTFHLVRTGNTWTMQRVESRQR
jgi:hypothetical protein